jgi:hypothetical protein
MKLYALPLCGLALAMSLSTPMFADTLFDFSFTGNSSVSGTPDTPGQAYSMSQRRRQPESTRLSE